MWLTSSSVGRKLIMALTGACLVLFLTFHVLMNAVAILWPGAYNQICAFLGANWYALIASAGLGLLFVIHIIYALILTFQNRKARGNDRYDLTSTPKSVEWSSQNMLVLGIVIVAFLAVHMVQFWYKMQWQEIWGHWYADAQGATIPAAAGTLFIQLAFQDWWTPVLYIVGFVALWFHLNHGIWSMFQSAGWSNKTWLPRLKTVACWWTSIVVGLFVVQALWFTYEASNKTYLTDEALNQQYFEMYQEELQKEMIELQKSAGDFNPEVQKEAEKIYRQSLRSIKTYAPTSFEKLGIPEEQLQEPVENVNNAVETPKADENVVLEDSIN
ncbi:MAG: succinate dehydrogenase cytochrome b subunit [Muribaculaceae bacterium]|nr:succinate dehydrogenase cytochrome b subunit [Muribaculaceae bacterium]MBQ9073559.1 succinate dehydrogenase cytochrome b subunit [Muribaculaceae bacterium]